MHSGKYNVCRMVTAPPLCMEALVGLCMMVRTALLYTTVENIY